MKGITKMENQVSIMVERHNEAVEEFKRLNRVVSVRNALATSIMVAELQFIDLGIDFEPCLCLPTTHRQKVALSLQNKLKKVSEGSEY